MAHRPGGDHVDNPPDPEGDVPDRGEAAGAGKGAQHVVVDRGAVDQRVGTVQMLNVRPGSFIMIKMILDYRILT